MTVIGIILAFAGIVTCFQSCSAVSGVDAWWNMIVGAVLLFAGFACIGSSDKNDKGSNNQNRKSKQGKIYDARLESVRAIRIKQRDSKRNVDLPEEPWEVIPKVIGSAYHYFIDSGRILMPGYPIVSLTLLDGEGKVVSGYRWKIDKVDDTCAFVVVYPKR